MTFILGTAFALLGAVLASFIGVLADRIHTGEPIVSGRSRCNSCGRQLSFLDLVPMLSWLLSLGRCRTCKARVPAIYALSETTLAVVFVLAYLKLETTVMLVVFLAAITVLTFIVLYDLRHMIVPPVASGLFVLLSAVFAVLSFGSGQLFGTVLLTAGSIALGFFLLFVLSKGRAMGLGDSPVALALCLLAGPFAFSGLLLSFWSGALIGIGILVSHPKGHRMGIEVPFVPFLALGYLLAIFTQWNPLTLSF